MRTAGLTLIEVLVALVIIAVAFMALASTQIMNMRVTRDSQIASIATQIGNEMLEQVTRDIYAGVEPNYAITTYYGCNPCVTSGTFPSNDFPNITSALAPNLTAYSYVVTITSLYSDPTDFLNEGLIEIDINITGPSSLKFTAYATCYDVSKTPSLEEGDPCPSPYDPLAGG